MIAAQANSPLHSGAAHAGCTSCWHNLTLLLVAIAISGCPSATHEGASNDPGGGAGSAEHEPLEPEERGSTGGSTASHVDAGTGAPEPTEPTPSADAGQGHELRETVDFACEQAADCEIKNVGNCCGYYPRCVSVGSPTPPVECDEGVSSVCGWPDISHCECVENTCRSMQGDSEI